ncbi:MAG: hypothetical protein AAGJ82_03080, partial [Bacteroidota bacterium]
MNSTSVTTEVNTVSFDNIDATVASPFPGCDGANTPVNEVWFFFEATGTTTIISAASAASGVALYTFSSTNGSCSLLIPRGCGEASGAFSLQINTIPGETYYVAVGPEQIDNFDDFVLEITSTLDCNNCTAGYELELSPPPVNGNYNSGEEVEVCLTVEWEVTNSIEWIHSVEFEFGNGWDIGSLIPGNVSSCDGSGQWSWYESWESCANAGDGPFGPGFAYDSAAGIDDDASCNTGGSANDGDPGNNWGDDLGACGDAIEFCFDLTVQECPNISTGEDLSVIFRIYTDGQTGSYTGNSCNVIEGGSEPLGAFATAICCDDDPPLVDVFEMSCPDADDAYLEIEGNGGFDPDEVFNFIVLDETGSVVYECFGCSGVVTTDNDLSAGEYTVLATNVATGCTPSPEDPVVVDDLFQPQAIIDVVNLPCPGGTATLEGSVDPSGGTEIYEWSGPGGATYFGQTVSVPDAGNYTLDVTVDGCEAQSATVNVQFVDFSVEIYGNDEVCLDLELELDATDAESWEWVDLNTGQVLGNNQELFADLLLSTIIQVTATDENGCTATDQLPITVHELPDITITESGSACENAVLTLSAEGAGPFGFYEWTDFAGEPNPRDLDNFPPGSYDFEVVGTDENGCMGRRDIEVTINPAPDVELVPSSVTVCEGEDVTVTVTPSDNINEIDWMGAGPAGDNPITVTINEFTTIQADVTNFDGCTAENVSVNVGVTTPEPPVDIICGTPQPDFIEFSWFDVDGATEYEISIDGGDPFPVFSTDFIVDDLTPNTSVTITVQPIGADLCPVEVATQTCSTASCPVIQLDIDPVDPICRAGSASSITLGFSTDAPGGTASWSGPGITNTATGTFNPTAANVGNNTITLTYTSADGSCPYETTIDIEVNDTPTSSFEVSDLGPICINDPVIVEYTGTAAAGATYNWDFDGGSANPGGMVQGPQALTWTTPGTRTITLTVTENGCSSTQTTQSVSVVGPISAPMVSCGTSTVNSATFTWPPVSGATFYTINTISGPSNGTLTGESYTVNDLAPGQSVTISVTANTNNACGPVTSTEVTCSALDCPTFNINITPLNAICLTAGSPAVTLNASASGGGGGGTITWSGPGVTGNQFDPNAAGAGTHTITATYTEGDCSGEQTTTVNVFATPVAALAATSTTVCTDQATVISFTGTAGAGATYAWNFNGGDASPGTGGGDQTVSWPASGPKTVTVTVTENGCVSNTATLSITVDDPLAEPVISCTPTVTSVIFTWPEVPGATGYQVNVTSIPADAVATPDLANRTFTVTGLQAEESVTIEVTAEGGGACGNSSATFTCQAQNCPVITVDVSSVDPVCLTTDVMDIQLVAAVTGGNGTGTL